MAPPETPEQASANVNLALQSALLYSEADTKASFVTALDETIHAQALWDGRVETPFDREQRHFENTAAEVGRIEEIYGTPKPADFLTAGLAELDAYIERDHEFWNVEQPRIAKALEKARAAKKAPPADPWGGRR